ncbi:exopolyphosphatase / guanosine-5'-triphosphate,3'-diphosphate pyrophosphatase [Corynebacterium appendicis CIP 107643]|uniref:Exopolyphosphatase / guanosine-5'-triphosphate,3'-diphosphate pyrophosphatase n=1 Tax=Corynebacterium appendicis CIP 107643 TaxID=1161099 RepID=A0A1N7JM93_9CORY|nr:Ppx/GppA phosphatase family protein [Corynebacterium appendicis]WJY61582.1 Guanosine-5'-triphosphate,3'-diphosphate pyrophosphatase [Corynebacterium appendicis CIP 107643]SIS50482.1 exopolyphosphatase / guanosine-5'-triphosphate,3'-diphosphate pyrophosphatase [Corynebacterium appendicis CIP 107643]
MTRVAAVDCGTNSIRLLIHDSEAGEICREMTIVRLGEGVDATGQFSPDAIARTREALETYVERMVAEGVEAVRMVATSATRDAANRDEFFDMTRELLGRIQPGAVAEVISGEEEAALSFRGATTDLDDARAPFCVIDLGGGSTEFIVGGEGAYSTQMGCVRITERFMRTDPPTDQETAAAREYIDSLIDDARATVPLSHAATFVGCAGTFTTLSAIAQDLDAYDPEAIHCSEITFDDMRAVTAKLRAQTAAQRLENPVMHAGRADVIGSGATVVEQLMTAIEKETGGAVTSFVISEKDILDGIVAGLL